jgi:prevent-host-death family protein
MSTMQVNIKEARQRFSELVNTVAHGREKVIITSRKKPKAVLVSIQDAELIKSDLVNKAHRRTQLTAISKIREKLATKIVASDSLKTLETLREERLGYLSDDN